MDMIQRLSRNVDERLGSDGGVDAEVKRWALEQIAEIDVELDRLIQPDGRKQFVTSYLKREKQRYQADSTEDLPEWLDAEETRDDPLCTCKNSDCDVKKGRIPVQVDEGNLIEGIRVFAQDHPGHPVALLGASEEYLASRGKVQRVLRLVYASLGSNEILDTDYDPDEDVVDEAGEEATPA